MAHVYTIDFGYSDEIYPLDSTDPISSLLTDIADVFDKNLDKHLTWEEVEKGFENFPISKWNLNTQLKLANDKRAHYIDDSFTNNAIPSCRLNESESKTKFALQCYFDKLTASKNHFRTSLYLENLTIFSAEQIKTLAEKQPALKFNVRSTNNGSTEEAWVSRACMLFKSKSDWWQNFCDGYERKILRGDDYLAVLGVRNATAKLIENNSDKAILDTFTIHATPYFMTRVLSDDPFTWGNPLATYKMIDGEKTANIGVYAYSTVTDDTTELLDYCTENKCGTIPFLRLHAISFLEEYMEDIDKAAEIIATAHPDLHKNNIKLILMWRFYNEVYTMTYADIVQDYAACRAVGCDLRENYEMVFPELNHSETDTVWNLSNLITSDKKGQGYGAPQLIWGMAIEAANHKDTAKYYREYLEPEDLESEEAILKTTLDPKKSIYLTSMTLQYIITRFKETTFKDKDVGYASNFHPYIFDRDTARQMAILELAQEISAYPERAERLADKVAGTISHEFWSQVFMLGEKFGIEHHFTGLQLVRLKKDFLSYKKVNQPQGMPLSNMHVGPMYEIHFLAPVDPFTAYVIPIFKPIFKFAQSAFYCATGKCLDSD